MRQLLDATGATHVDEGPHVWHAPQSMSLWHAPPTHSFVAVLHVSPVRHVLDVAQ